MHRRCAKFAPGLNPDARARCIQGNRILDGVPMLALVVDACAMEWATIGGSGRVHADPLKAGNMKLAIAGSGALAIDRLEAKGVTVAIAASGNARLAGHADTLDATVAGSDEVASTGDRP
jgi:hypothetical protein